MKALLTPPTLSLRVKLMLSYIGVALGAILILAIAVSIAVQNYFNSTQQNLLHAHADNLAHQIGYFYRVEGGSWNSVSFQLETSDPVIITDTSGRQLICGGPTFLSPINCHDPVLNQALAQALQVVFQVPGCDESRGV